MLERYFEAPHTLRRLRAGPTGPYIDGFAEDLYQAGYAHWSARGYLRATAHFGRWIDGSGIAVATINERTLEGFSCHLPECLCLRKNRGLYTDAVPGARLFIDHLRRTGVVTPAVDVQARPIHSLIEDFRRWMLRQRNVTESTLVVYMPLLVEMIDMLGDESRQYDAAGVRRFVFERAGRHGRSRAKSVVSAVRMFLRFLAVHGLCDADLDLAVPTIAEWKLSSLPRYISTQDVDQVVRTCDLKTVGGMRDRAILLLLARLGLRASDVAALRVNDIDWTNATLSVAGKSRRQTRLPLPQEVGDAILRYIERARPAMSDDHVFLSLQAPIRPLRSGAVSFLVGRAIGVSGIDAPTRGAHLLRHSAATGLLRQGASLDVIGSLLRHSSLQTTLLYAKVDVSMLQQVAQPWPTTEVASC